MTAARGGVSVPGVSLVAADHCTSNSLPSGLSAVGHHDLITWYW